MSIDWSVNPFHCAILIAFFGENPTIADYFQSIDHPSEDLILVKQGELFGYADTEGRIAIPPVFEAAEKSSKGLLKVKYKGRWGYFKTPGSIILNDSPVFCSIFDTAEFPSVRLASILPTFISFVKI